MSAIRIENTYNDWRPVRSIYFHRCADTNELIWPLSAVYYCDQIDTSVRAQLRLRSMPTWITSKAYMIRKLKGEA